MAPKRSGKTTNVAELVRTCPRVAIYDPRAVTDVQYRRVASHIIVHDMNELRQVIAEDNFQVLFEPLQPEVDGEEYYFSDFRPFVRMCWRRAQLIGPMTIIVDEAHFTMSKRSMPPEIADVVTTGGHYGCDLIWITQRFTGVNSWARANADEYWFFRVIHPADLKTIADICGPEIADQVQNLRRLDLKVQPVVPGELLKWNSLDGSVEVIDNGKSTSPKPEDDRRGSDGQSQEDAGNGQGDSDKEDDNAA